MAFFLYLCYSFSEYNKLPPNKLLRCIIKHVKNFFLNLFSYICTAKKDTGLREYGLIGYPLDHAFSKTYFENKFASESISDVKYHLFPISEIQRLPRILASHPNLFGLNVTTPYKELVIPYLDDLDSLAMSIGAVNTVTILNLKDKVLLKGYNTDVVGVDKLLANVKLPEKALILGSGGSSRTVCYALKLHGVRCLIASRDPMYDDQIRYDEINKEVLITHPLVINCTPVGMYPRTDEKPDIPYQYITDQHVVIDLIYNPKKTAFLNACEKQGALIRNGFGMLTEQADKAWDIWQRAYKEFRLVTQRD